MHLILAVWWYVSFICKFPFWLICRVSIGAQNVCKWCKLSDGSEMTCFQINIANSALTWSWAEVLSSLLSKGIACGLIRSSFTEKINGSFQIHPRPEQNGSHFADKIFICNFLNENHVNLIQISLDFGPKGSTNNTSTLVKWMASGLVLNRQQVTVKPVCNDHLYNKIYYLWFIQLCALMMTEGVNLLMLTISAFWSPSRWPLAT